MSVTRAPSHGSTAYQQVEQFKHRDDRGGDKKIKGLASKTPDAAADQLLRKHNGWQDKNRDGVTVVSYGYPNPPAERDKKQPGLHGHSPVTDEQKIITREAMNTWEDVANVRFVERPKDEHSEGHINFGNAQTRTDSKGKSENINPHASRGTDATSIYTPKGTFDSRPHGLQTMTHEIGHALGLSHPGDYNGKKNAGNWGYAEDKHTHSTMSYRHHGKPPAGPQLDDITAAQKQYGANYETRKGDTTYGFNSNADRPHLRLESDKDELKTSIWDGGGTDTLDLSGYKKDQKISLVPGTFSNANGGDRNLSIAYGVVIENAKGGAGNDLMVGNDADNELHGGDGNDIMYGGKGGDSLWGGKGADLFVYGSASESFDIGNRDQRSHDEIMDFESGKDKIDLSGIKVQNGGKPLTFKSSPLIAPGEAFIDYDPGTNKSTLLARQTNGEILKISVNGKLAQSDVVL